MSCGCGSCPYVGASVKKEYRPVDADGAPVDTTVTVVIKRPDGSTITDQPVAHDDTGLYSFTVIATQAGQWWWKFTGAGAANSPCEGAFLVADTMVPTS